MAKKRKAQRRSNGRLLTIEEINAAAKKQAPSDPEAPRAAWAEAVSTAAWLEVLHPEGFMSWTRADGSRDLDVAGRIERAELRAEVRKKLEAEKTEKELRHKDQLGEVDARRKNLSDEILRRHLKDPRGYKHLETLRIRLRVEEGISISKSQLSRRIRNLPPQ